MRGGGVREAADMQRRPFVLRTAGSPFEWPAEPTEMPPGLPESCLRLGGNSYTSELRFAAFDGRR